MQDSITPIRRSFPFMWCYYALAVGVILWSYWPVLTQMQHKWAADPKYSHGYLVVAIAAAILWKRRDLLQEIEPKQDWWGLAVILAGFGIRYGGHRIFMIWIESVSLLVCLAGVFITLSGWRSLR